MPPGQHTKRLVAGLATFVPGLVRITERSTGGTNAADYCYWIWLRHLILLHGAGLLTAPRVVGELGPGDSLGAGIAALLTGSDRYYALDIVEYADTRRNLEVLDELHGFLERRLPLPLDRYDDYILGREEPFPHEILDEERLRASLAPPRVAAVRRAVERLGEREGEIAVAYASGGGETLRLPESADLIFSQAVLEHVEDPAAVYRAIYSALRPGGIMSHAIDFRSHDFARAWNGHWTFSDLEWRLVRGRRRFAINREPLSRHLELMRAAGFELVRVERAVTESPIRRDQLAPRFRGLTDDDLVTGGVVVQAVRATSP